VVIRETAIPSVLMEVGFVSNPSERAKLLNKDYQDTIAKSITEGVVEHLKSMKSSHAATISPD
jgi:N-acetylmuramoyl-L-alanine amidase